jgi:large subunit ribosomal protein L18
MEKAKEVRKSRARRHARVRKRVWGTQEKPRLTVFRSLKYIYVQVVNDTSGVTLCSASSMSKEIRSAKPTGPKLGLSKDVGKLVAEKAMAMGIKAVVFDRGGYKYAGRVKALADAAREAGLKF